MTMRQKLLKAQAFGIHEHSDTDRAFMVIASKVKITEDDRVETAESTFDAKTEEYRVLVNTRFFARVLEKYSDEKQIAILRGIIKHEFLHIASGHLLMIGQRIEVPAERLRKIGFPEPEKVVLDLRDEAFRLLYNLAADSVINSSIEELKVLDKLPPEEFIEPKQEISKDNFYIVGETRIFTEEINYGYSYTVEDLTAALYIKFKDKFNDENFLNRLRSLYVIDLDYVFGDIMKSAVNSFRGIYGNLTIGNVPFYPEKYNIAIDNILSEKKIDWQTELRMLVSSHMEMSKGLRINKHRPNKRYGIPPKIVRDFSKKLLVLVDSSGSVSYELLRKFIAEVRNIIRQTGADVILYTYSIGVQKHDVRNFQSGLNISERGGTSLSNALNQVDDKDKRVDGIIILTDGFDYFPEEELRKIKAFKIFLLPHIHGYKFKASAKKHGKIIVADIE
ncbi:MAG: VWA-like domain-containing protein [Fervidobacterium sp.]|uniref:VWA-like domain-containing protein n=1 Tax=Fervidobacterium sp. TaxID=1871331 RepID=UPI00309FBC09